MAAYMCHCFCLWDMHLYIPWPVPHWNQHIRYTTLYPMAYVSSNQYVWGRAPACHLPMSSFCSSPILPYFCKCVPPHLLEHLVSPALLKSTCGCSAMNVCMKYLLRSSFSFSRDRKSEMCQNCYVKYLSGKLRKYCMLTWGVALCFFGGSHVFLMLTFVILATCVV